MECYAQTISVSLSLKLQPVNAKVDMWTVHCPRGGGGGGGGTKGKFG